MTWLKLVKAILRNQKGEMLIESILSFTVFAMLLVSVGTIVFTSFRISTHYMDLAEENQTTINSILLEEMPQETTLQIENRSKGIEVSIPIVQTDEESAFFAFAPKAVSTP